MKLLDLYAESKSSTHLPKATSKPMKKVFNFAKTGGPNRWYAPNKGIGYDWPKTTCSPVGHSSHILKGGHT